MIWTVTSWNTVSCFKAWFEERYTGPHDLFWQARTAYISPFWRVVDFDTAIWSWNPKSNIVETCLCRAKVAKPRVVWEDKSSILLTYLCTGDLKKQAFPPIWYVCSHLFWTNRCLGKPDGAARDVIWIALGNSIIVRKNVSAKTTAKPSKIKLFHRLPPAYYLNATELENPVD